MLSDDIDQVLRDYYDWDRIENPAAIGYPPKTLTARLVGRGASQRISDDEALHIDRALCSLREDHPDAFNVVRDVYQRRKSIRWLAQRGRGSRTRISELANHGRQYVGGFLAGSWGDD